MVERTDITGLILAGGQGRRMGGADKGLLPFRGKPLIEHVIERLAPQVGGLMISANRNRERYAIYGYPVLADTLPGYQGPLAGIAAGLQSCPTPWLVTAPCDGPFLPADLVARLAKVASETHNPLVYAATPMREHPTYLLLRREMASTLLDYLAGNGRALQQWCRQQDAASAFFADEAAFLNLNCSEQLAGDS